MSNACMGAHLHPPAQSDGRTDTVEPPHSAWQLGGAAAVSEVLTSVRAINKTDVLTLLSHFGSVAGIMLATPEALAMCPGFGEKKVRRLWDALHGAIPTAAGGGGGSSSSAGGAAGGGGLAVPTVFATTAVPAAAPAAASGGGGDEDEEERGADAVAAVAAVDAAGEP